MCLLNGLEGLPRRGFRPTAPAFPGRRPQQAPRPCPASSGRSSASGRRGLQEASRPGPPEPAPPRSPGRHPGSWGPWDLRTPEPGTRGVGAAEHDSYRTAQLRGPGDRRKLRALDSAGGTLPGWHLPAHDSAPSRGARLENSRWSP